MYVSQILQPFCLQLFPSIYRIIFHANEDKAIKKFAEQKQICQTMGWWDYNQGNLSAFDGDLGPVEVKMGQIIQEQDENIFGRAHKRIVKAKEQANPLKNIISGSSKSSAPDSQEEDEVCFFLFFICASFGSSQKRL